MTDGSANPTGTLLANIPLELHDSPRWCLIGSSGKGTPLAWHEGELKSAIKGGWAAALNDGRLKTYEQVRDDLVLPSVMRRVLPDKLGYLPINRDVVIDVDPIIGKNAEKIESPSARLLREKWKDTYIERSSSGKGYHFFFRLPEGVVLHEGKRSVNLSSIYPEMTELTGVECFCGDELGSYLVCTGDCVGADTIALIPEELLQLIEKTNEPKQHITPPKGGIGEKAKAPYKGENSITQRFLYDKNVTDYLSPLNASKIGGEIVGAHPIHGSTTGTNLHVNQQENIWYCFRDGSGGGVFEAWAVARGLIECSDVKTGWFGSLGNEKKREILSRLEEEFPERIEQFDDLNLSLDRSLALYFASKNERRQK